MRISHGCPQPSQLLGRLESRRPTSCTHVERLSRPTPATAFQPTLSCRVPISTTSSCVPSLPQKEAFYRTFYSQSPLLLSACLLLLNPPPFSLVLAKDCHLPIWQAAGPRGPARRLHRLSISPTVGPHLRDAQIWLLIRYRQGPPRSLEPVCLRRWRRTEAVTTALAEALKMEWREQASKMIVLIADAPPHGIGEYRDSEVVVF